MYPLQRLYLSQNSRKTGRSKPMPAEKRPPCAVFFWIDWKLSSSKSFLSATHPLRCTFYTLYDIIYLQNCQFFFAKNYKNQKKKERNAKMDATNAIQILQSYLSESKQIVFFGGAGVSTESVIPDFRSTDGLYHMQYDDPPEVILSHSYFEAYPEKFFAFYRDKMLFPDAKPNPAHLFLARLEQAGKLTAVVTQNIDGLHQKAGSKRVLELHGSVWRNYCTNCGKSYSLTDIQKSTGVPRCSCGGIIKPDVVLYEEALDQDVLTASLRAIANADLLIIGGTSLAVYPAAGLIDYFHGKHLVLINRSATERDKQAALCIHGSIGEVFSKLQIL
jgi:NAD-dependent deacetylase